MELAKIEKAEPISRDYAADESDLVKKVEQYQKFIDLNKEELQLREDMLKFQKEHPKVLKPNFDFEAQEGWEEFNIRQWELNFKNESMKIEGAIELTVAKKLQIEAELEQVRAEMK